MSEERQMTREEKIELAAQAALLFHHGGPWTDDDRVHWQFMAQTLLGHCTQKTIHGLPVDLWDCTTRVLCDMLRAALK